jgi:hypothetical protein
MKPSPEKSPHEVLTGLVERVTYHNAENGFCVLRTKPSAISNASARSIPQGKRG